MVTDSWDVIPEDISIKFGKVTYKSKLVEVAQDHSKDPEVMEEDKIKSQELLRKSNIEQREEEREELDTRDRESEASLEEEKEN